MRDGRETLAVSERAEISAREVSTVGPTRRRLGTADWYDEFYKIETKPTLFGDHQVQVKASMDVMARYFNNRLKQVFAGVANKPGVLSNSSKNPLYLLCFAVGNENGKKTALNIANHLLKTIITEVR